MQSLLQGIASFPHILTEADVIAHNSEFYPDAGQDSSLPPDASVPPDAHAPSPEPVDEIPPPPPEEPSKAATLVEPLVDESLPNLGGNHADEGVAGDAPGDVVSDDNLSDEELAAKLEKENTKAALVSMAEAANLDQSGNKSELSARLVSHWRSPK